jgi:putative transposase
MKKESGTVDRRRQVDSPSPQRHLPLVDLLVDKRAELMELAVASGLKVLHTMLENDRTAICGPRYQHQADRDASRAGTVGSEAVLGGRKVQIRRPRVRANGEEIALPTLNAFADTDPLNRRVME